MKIKNLIAVAALLMGSTTALAQGPGLGAQFAYNGIVYETSNIVSEDLTADAVAWGVSDNANGLALLDNTNPTVIPAELTVTVDGEDWTITVIGVDDYFAINGEDPATIETLSIDETNFLTAEADFSSGDLGFVGLKNLTIVDNAETPLLAAFITLEDPTILETLDISACLGITEIAASYFEGGALQSIALPETFETINNKAFKDCADLAVVNFPDALVKIGQEAFRNTAISEADLTATGIDIIQAGVFAGTQLTSFTVPAAVTQISTGAFAGCESLATVTFEEGSLCTKIMGKAFKQTAISSIELPEAITTLNSEVFAYTQFTEFTIQGGDPANPITIAASAFEGCAKLKTFNFVGADMWTIGDNMDDEAFLGCIPFVTINAPQDFIDAWRGAYTMEAPTNCKFVAKETLVVDGTIAIKNGFAKWFHNVKPIAIDAEKYKAFSVYVDNGAKKKDGTAYFQGLKKVNGRYYIPAQTHVILQALDATAEEVEYQDMSIYGLPDISVLIDEIFTFDKDYTLAKFQLGTTTVYNLWGYGVYDANMFVYRLTNNNGIGFRLFQGVTMKGGEDDGITDTCADAQFFIQSIRQPDAAGRLNVVWLDEDGNEIEGNATAIQSVEKVAEDGAIYNLQGVRVNAAKKGLYIQNGKKFIVK